ncbi:MAG: rRNA cytosine-C5-methyltransferase [Paramuribaculum sp.]|nr:rRNA cytosine-C5-methyltransferase [Paramuribaculum sp.]MDE6488072.1 rRNA cytosine-C5-methyltransferase [Paramuribaculum sp.]
MALPEGFITMMKSCRPSWLATLVDALGGEPSVAVRLNTGKTAPGSTVSGGRRVGWNNAGFHLSRRPAFTFDPALHQGLYYVQDASSMFVGHVVGELTRESGRPLTVLDACAAPGGKTTAVIDALPQGSIVVANEFVAKRAAVLRENLAKWGYPYVVVTQGDTDRFSSVGPVFDLIVADVPCSGEGMMRKDDDAVSQWSESLVAQCSRLQHEILRNLWGALKPGGFLIYSTCTFNTTEDESTLAWLADEFGAEAVEVSVDGSWGVAPALAGTMPACRFIPGLIEGEGLFMAVVRKPADGSSSVALPVRKKNKSVGKQKAAGQVAIPKDIAGWLLPEWPADIKVDGDRVVAVFRVGGAFVPALELGVIKGRDVVPSQELAMSRALDRSRFNQVEVDRATAIDYLRCEAIALPEGAPRGIVLLTYGGNPLGFAKNLGNRANNLYPRAWRIVSARPAQLPEPVRLS